MGLCGQVDHRVRVSPVQQIVPSGRCGGQNADLTVRHVRSRPGCRAAQRADVEAVSQETVQEIWPDESTDTGHYHPPTHAVRPPRFR